MWPTRTTHTPQEDVSRLPLAINPRACPRILQYSLLRRRVDQVLACFCTHRINASHEAVERQHREKQRTLQAQPAHLKISRRQPQQMPTCHHVNRHVGLEPEPPALAGCLRPLLQRQQLACIPRDLAVVPPCARSSGTQRGRLRRERELHTRGSRATSEKAHLLGRYGCIVPQLRTC